MTTLPYEKNDSEVSGGLVREGSGKYATSRVAKSKRISVAPIERQFKKKNQIFISNQENHSNILMFLRKYKFSN